MFWRGAIELKKKIDDAVTRYLKAAENGGVIGLSVDEKFVPAILA